MTTIADELEDRLWYLADPAVVWVPGEPHGGESCLIMDVVGETSWIISYDAELWLRGFVIDYQSDQQNRQPWLSEWNEGRTRDEVLWMLEEAVDQARWEGV